MSTITFKLKGPDDIEDDSDDGDCDGPDDIGEATDLSTQLNN